MISAPKPHPFRKQHIYRLPRGNRRVTVCISAIADRDEAIVSCVDTRISTNQTSIDLIVGRKMCGMRGWIMLSSGTTCYSEALVDTFQALLQHAKDNDPPTIQRLLEGALLTELMKYGTARYLAPYGIDMPTFLSSGSDKFSDERRTELNRLIADHAETYDVELIVSGWGQTQESFGPNQAPSACIYSVSRDGVLPHSDDGFYTCGTGKNAAHAVLSYFSLERHMTLSEALYRVAAAKFMCERTDGVGPNTVLHVATRRAGEFGGYYIQPAEIAQIRSVWDASGAPRMTDEAEDIIVQILRPHGPQHIRLEHMVRNVKRDIEQNKQANVESNQHASDVNG